MALLFLPLLLLLLLLFPVHSLSQTNITIGDSISAAETSNPWRSPSGDFAFGFQRLPDNQNFFILSIWFDKIPNKTIVWYEQETYPVPRGSILRLDATAGIILQIPGGGSPITITEGITDRVSDGFLNDTGNFVLRSSDSTSLWESFAHPTDTLLPSQVIGVNGGLISRNTVSNFSRGRFNAKMNSNGNFVLSTKSLVPDSVIDKEYHSFEASDLNQSNSGYQFVLDDRATLYVRRRNGQQEVVGPVSSPPASDNYYRVTLEFDGILAMYFHPKNIDANSRWNIAQPWPSNICNAINGFTGSGACGYNNVCNMENQRPVCKCPKGFSLADPNNSYGDCMPNYVQNCIQGDNPEIGYDLFEVSDTDWPFNDYQSIDPCTEERCRILCLNDCLCGVAIFRDNKCWKKRLPLSNGKIDNGLGAKAFLKFKKSGDAPSFDRNGNLPKPKREDDTRILVGSVLLGTSVFVNFLLIGALCLGLFFVYKKKSRVLNLVRYSSGPNVRSFTYKELVEATDGFKEELGRGAFGIVYKGRIPNGWNSNTIVAVKNMDRLGQDSTNKEFKAEVNAIGKTHHRNLVGLIGFCEEGTHRILVYEFISNGTLSSLLFGDARPSWRRRTQIALGVARGLTYLHEECSTQIIHCDIKPQNILLDDYYNARISDFGLAKLLMLDQSRTLTSIRGTKGYVAPEWFRNVQVNAKVDVYSFGVLLLEIVTCKKSVNFENENENENPVLMDWAWDCFTRGEVRSLVGDDGEALNDEEMLERFVRVALWCIQEDAAMRPTMRKASQMLEGIVVVEVPPYPYVVTSEI